MFLSASISWVGMGHLKPRGGASTVSQSPLKLQGREGALEPQELCRERRNLACVICINAYICVACSSIGQVCSVKGTIFRAAQGD